MKNPTLVSCLGALLLCACAGTDELGPSESQETQLARSGSEGTSSFVTDDARYVLGRQFDAQGALLHAEVVYDTSSSYLTPQTPNDSWIVDGAMAHTHQRPLLLTEVAVLGLYVRSCVTGEWINAAVTPFAAASELLQGTFNGTYVVSHYYENIQTNVLLDSEFDCLRETPSFATVTIDGEEREVQRVGDVEFAYVVEHRE